MLKNSKKILAAALALATMTTMFGCGGKQTSSTAASSTAPASTTAAGAGETLNIFNSKGENADQFTAMCADYQKETGVTTKAFSVGSGTDHMEPLRAQITSSSAPTIYSVQGLKELKEWVDGGQILDLTTVQDADFKKVVDGIDEGLRLTNDGKSSYGVPYNVEGYGYMVDSQMLADLFGEPSKDGMLKDLRTCSYEDFTKLCDAITAYIKTPSAAEITLNGNKYKFQASKTGLAAKLNGVFAFAGSEKWTYGDHLINVSLNCVFKGQSDANAATEEQVNSLKDPFIAYAKTLDFVSQHAAGLKSAGKRGNDLINKANYGYDQSVQMFADGNAVFLQQGNWASSNVNKVNADVAKRSSFIPVKMPVTDAMMKAQGMTAAKFNSSIPVFVPNYYVINSKASDAQKKLAYDFLTWLEKPENTKKYVIESFKAVPYSADSSVKLDDAFGNSMLTYMAEGNTIAAPYNGAPATWSGDVVGKKIMEEYLTKEKWADADYNAIADYAIAQWKELKNAQ